MSFRVCESLQDDELSDQPVADDTRERFSDVDDFHGQVCPREFVVDAVHLAIRPRPKYTPNAPRITGKIVVNAEPLNLAANGD